jgi:hypothetical protein
VYAKARLFPKKVVKLDVYSVRFQPKDFLWQFNSKSSDFRTRQVMDWGDALISAFDSAKAGAKKRATEALDSVKAAGSLVKQKVIDPVVTGTVETGKAIGRVADFERRVVVETGTAIVKTGVRQTENTIRSIPLVGPLYNKAKAKLSPVKKPRERVVEPCPNSWAAKKQRLIERNALIKKGKSPASSAAQKESARRLAKNNEAVELARLSQDAYAQHKVPPVNQPPLGWGKVSDADLLKTGIDPRLLKDSKAVIYKTPTDWPGGQKTVLAFRGTEPTQFEDLTTNLDQALGGTTVQYQAATKLGAQVAKRLGPDTLVTGHSLGGGKAQAAGVRGGLKGMMFNSSGLNSRTVAGFSAVENQFDQYRAPHDPLTMLQNSAALQTALAGGAALATPFAGGVTNAHFVGEKLGLPILTQDQNALAKKVPGIVPKALVNLIRDGNFLPPAIGKITEVPSLDDNDKPIKAMDPLEQHSVHNVINGIEQQKSEDIATLKK